MGSLSSRVKIAAPAFAVAVVLFAASGRAQTTAAPTALAPPKPKTRTKAIRPATPPSPVKPVVPATTAAAGVTVTVAAEAVPPPAPPPPPPPAWTGPASTSFAGTQILPGAGAEDTPKSAADVAPFPIPQSPDIERRVEALEARLDAANARLRDYDGELRWMRMFKLSGYVQTQLLWQWYNAAASPNLVNGALPSGVTANDVTAQPVPAFNGVSSTTNGDYFRLRRARLKTEFMPADFARFVFEIDPTPAGGQTSGLGTIAREIEAEGIARWTDHVVTEFGAGIFKIPFGFEVLQNDADRPFIERSWGERNMTPGEFDTGARAYTTAFDGILKAQVAIINGNMEGEKTFSALPDLNQGKDLVGRVNYDFGPLDVGISGYYGGGQLVNASALLFKQYPRGAGNVEFAGHRVFARVLGETRVFAEGTLATNMDRGVYYAPGIGLPALPAVVTNGMGASIIPGVTSLHEASGWGRVEQDFTTWFTLGLRFDYYTPDTSQSNNGRATYGAVAAVHFTKWLQYMIEYDHSVDNVHAAGGKPPDKLFDVLSNVLQVRF
jgi:hypothetical protein